MKLTIALLGAVIILSSCDKYQEIASAEYPDQLIYLPAAVSGNYVINSISQPRGETPTPGAPFQFTVDLATKKFIVPLSVYRSGINNNGAFLVNIAANTDTITKAIAAGSLTDTDLLPSADYSIPASVNFASGEEDVPLNLSIDLDFLRNNSGNQFVAIGVGISSTARKSNPKFSTAVVVIDTKIMKPVADFEISTNAKDAAFTNNSLYANTYLWNFGDGSATSVETTPSHTYSSAGTYTVTLIATGITGDQDKSTKIATVTIL